MLDKKQVVLELMQRSQSHLNGVTAIFAKAGIDLKGSVPSIEQYNALNQYHPEVFCELIDFLYPEKEGVANASGSAWAGIVGAVLSGAGAIFYNLDSASGDQQLQQLEFERAMAEQRAAEQKKTLYIVLGLVSGVAVIGIALFFMLSNRR